MWWSKLLRWRKEKAWEACRVSWKSYRERDFCWQIEDYQWFDSISLWSDKTE